VDECICGERFYRALEAGWGVECVACPTGAECEDKSCALGRAGLTCSGDASIKGTWTRSGGALSRFRLSSCAAGYSLVNTLAGASVDPATLDRTSSGHDVQQCMKCLDEAQYILRPNEDACLKCSRGLKCRGDATLDPIVAGSVWVEEEVVGVGMIYQLVSCLAHHFVSPGGEDDGRCRSVFSAEKGRIALGIRAPTVRRAMLATTRRLLQQRPVWPAPRTLSTPLKAQRAWVTVNPVVTVQRRTGVGRPACLTVATQMRGTRLLWGTRALVQSVPLERGAPTGSVRFVFSGANLSCPEPQGLIIGEWSRDAHDNDFKLSSSPTGYALINNDNANGFVSLDAADFSGVNQRCSECGKGLECTLEECLSCSACAAGHFKDVASAEACRPCRADSFFETEGATDASSCKSCPVFSSTSGATGRTNVSSCFCNDETYLVLDAREALGQRCAPCPQGAQCQDRACAVLCNYTCKDETEVVGAWSWSGGDAEVVLESCPRHHYLINDEDATGTVALSSGEFSYGNQRCSAC